MATAPPASRWASTYGPRGSGAVLATSAAVGRPTTSPRMENRSVGVAGVGADRDGPAQRCAVGRGRGDRGAQRRRDQRDGQCEEGGTGHSDPLGGRVRDGRHGDRDSVRAGGVRRAQGRIRGGPSRPSGARSDAGASRRPRRARSCRPGGSRSSRPPRRARGGRRSATSGSGGRRAPRRSARRTTARARR